MLKKIELFFAFLKERAIYNCVPYEAFFNERLFATRLTVTTGRI